MKTIGLIGGMSWKSSLDYYAMMNEAVHERLGGWHSAKVIMYSVDFSDIDLEHHTKDWPRSDKILIDAAKALEEAGADFIIIGANTAHVLFDELQDSVGIPIIHIADATAEKIKAEKIRSVGLLGTMHTMDEDFYRGRLERKHGLRIVVPSEKEKVIVAQEINNAILGRVRQGAKKEFKKIIGNLVKNGAEGIILGCTEIPMIVSQKDVKVRLFDTARIHAEKAVDYSLE